MAVHYDKETGEYVYDTAEDPGNPVQQTRTDPNPGPRPFDPTVGTGVPSVDPNAPPAPVFNPGGANLPDLVTQTFKTAQGQAGNNGNAQAFGQAWLASGGKSAAELASFIRTHPEYGAQVAGSKGTKVTIGGQTYDPIFSADDPSQSRGQWIIAGDSSSNTSTGSGTLGTMAIDPSYLAPFTTPPPVGNPLPTYQPPPDFNYADFGGFDQWNPTTAQDLYADPSYAFRRDEGAGVLQNSAAARGVLNSGGTLSDLIKYGQQFASNEFGNVDTRRFNAWDTGNRNKLDTYSTNRNNAAQNFATNYGIGRDAYQTLANNNETDYQRQEQNWRDQRDTWYSNQQNPFSKLSTLASLGYNAASL